jgi:hypothetical protein
MIATSKWLAIVAVAFVAGSFIASPELRAFAANTVRSIDIVDGEVKTADLGNNAVTSPKIKDGEVKMAELGSNSVNSAKIKDGSVAYADLSRTLIAYEHRADCNCGGTGWDPDGTLPLETIFDSRITFNSVVAVTVSGSGLNICTAQIPFSGAAGVICTQNISNGASVNYAIFNNS